MIKQCSRCDAPKELSQFDVRPGSKDGRTGFCMECRRKSYRARYSRNENGIRDWQTQYRKSKPKDLLCLASSNDRNRRHRKRIASMPNAKELIHKKSRTSILQRHGVSAKQYGVMNEMQDGRCAICNKVNDSGRKLAIDHCHTTGETRSLLCSRCNCGLGQFLDSPELLTRAIDYLNGHRSLQMFAAWWALLPVRAQYGMA